MELQGELQRVSGTTLDAQGAANVWAGTTGLDLVGALNAKAGSSGLDLLAVLRRLIGSARGSTDPVFLTAVSPNMLTPNQASIETDATGWVASTGAPTIARSTAQFLDGAASLAVTATAVGPAQMNAATTPVTTAPVVAGKAYTARISFRAAVTARTVQTQINWYTAASGFISGVQGSGVADSISAWTEATCPAVVAPTTAAYAQVEAVVLAALATEVHYIDRISLVET